MPGDPTSASRFGYVAQHRPDWAEHFVGLFRTTYDPPEPVLEKKVRVLIYLSALASIGAVDGFRSHLKDAQAEGLTREAILEAILLMVPAVGYVPVLGMMEALADYPEDVGGAS